MITLIFLFTSLLWKFGLKKLLETNLRFKTIKFRWQKKKKKQTGMTNDSSIRQLQLSTMRTAFILFSPVQLFQISHDLPHYKVNWGLGCKLTNGRKEKNKIDRVKNFVLNWNISRHLKRIIETSFSTKKKKRYNWNISVT